MKSKRESGGNSAILNAFEKPPSSGHSTATNVGVVLIATAGVQPINAWHWMKSGPSIDAFSGHSALRNLFGILESAPGSNPTLWTSLSVL